MVKSLAIMFSLHQPIRIRSLEESLAEGLLDLGTSEVDLLDKLYDDKLNEKIFNRISERCYYKAFNIIKEALENIGSFRISLSISGTWLSQAERYQPKLMEVFKKLVDEGLVELVCQPYYHSLTSLDPYGLEEFREQVELHKRVLKEKFGIEPTSAEATEFIYNNDVGLELKKLGFKVALTEGVERILGWRSPHFVYRAYGSDLRLLLRNYRLSDDIGFRFSDTSWDKYPLRADVYASWIEATPGDLVLIALDFETLGEHHSEASGIFEFLKWLPIELKKRGIELLTITEAAIKFNPVDVYDVAPWNTISWADVEKDSSAWLGSGLQRSSYRHYFWLEPYVKALGGKFLEHWRNLGSTDFFYYQSDKAGPSREVHKYFNPYSDRNEAFATYLQFLTMLTRSALTSYLSDLRTNAWKLQCPTRLAFQLYDEVEGKVTMLRTLDELLEAIYKVRREALASYVRSGDIQRWLSDVVLWRDLAEKVDKLKVRKNDIDLVRGLARVLRTTTPKSRSH